MPAVTVWDLPEETYRALIARAAMHGRSVEAEVHAIVENAVRPEGRMKIGSLLADIARRAGVTNEDVVALEQIRDQIRSDHRG